MKRTFVIVWAGQLVSNIGSALTSFGLALWVFQETGSATRLATVILAARLPALLIAPFVGALVDRWNRRTAMILSDAGAAAATVVIAVLLATGNLEFWHLYPALILGGLAESFQFPAYSAATTLLVDREQYGRAAGMVQLAGSIGRVAGPALAAVLLVWTGLAAIFFIDLATFVVALVTLLSVRFPEHERTAQRGRGVTALLKETLEGLSFVASHRGLLGLLITFSAVNFAFSFQSVLLLPLLLGFVSETSAGTAVSISAFGLVGGSLLMSTWGGPENRVRGLLLALATMGAGLAIAGVRPDLVIVVTGLVIVHVALPIAAGTSQAIWQSKVPPGLQGRVFSVRHMLAIGSTPVAFLLAGRLADSVFEPMLQPGGALAGTLGAIIGTGTGRGVGMLFILMGLFVATAAAVASLYPRIAHLDTEIPDVELAEA